MDPDAAGTLDERRASCRTDAARRSRAACTARRRRTRPNRRRRGRRSRPASTPASTTSTTSSSATRDLPARPRHGAARAADVPVQLRPDRQAEGLTSIRGGTSFWVTAGTRRRALEHADRAGDVSARRRAQRRAAVGPAAARHPRDDGDVLLLRDRPEPLRGRQHRVRRHPEAARLRRRRRAARSSSARPTRSSAAGPARSARKADADGRRQGALAELQAQADVRCRSRSAGTARRRPPPSRSTGAVAPARAGKWSRGSTSSSA